MQPLVFCAAVLAQLLVPQPVYAQLTTRCDLPWISSYVVEINLRAKRAVWTLEFNSTHGVVQNIYEYDRNRDDHDRYFPGPDSGTLIVNGLRIGTDQRAPLAQMAEYRCDAQ